MILCGPAPPVPNVPQTDPALDTSSFPGWPLCVQSLEMSSSPPALTSPFMVAPFTLPLPGQEPSLHMFTKSDSSMSISWAPTIC